MKLYIGSDGWPFFEQADGSLTDKPDERQADLFFPSLGVFMEWDDGVREATGEEYKFYLGVCHA
jgi:hypothetical protein